MTELEKLILRYVGERGTVQTHTFRCFLNSRGYSLRDPNVQATLKNLFTKYLVNDNFTITSRIPTEELLSEVYSTKSSNTSSSNTSLNDVDKQLETFYGKATVRINQVESRLTQYVDDGLDDLRTEIEAVRKEVDKLTKILIALLEKEDDDGRTK